MSIVSNASFSFAHPARSGQLSAPVSLLARVASTVAEHPDPEVFGPAVLDVLGAASGAVGARIVRTIDGREVARWSAGDVDPAAAAGSAAIRRPIPGTDASGAPDTLVLVGADATFLDRHPDFDVTLALLGAVLAPVDRARALAHVVAVNAAAAEAERDFAAAVLDALPVGVYVTDREHRVRLWNRKREVDTLGVARDVAIGRSIFDVLPRQDPDLMRRELDTVLATGQLQQFDTESSSSGEARTYRLSKIPMTLDLSAPTHVITVGEDVTAWKAALHRTAQAEKLAALGQLAAGVMHEINNPLGTIAACAETMTLALDDLPREQHPAGFNEYLRIVDHEVHRCRRIVDGLLNFSRARELRRAPVPLDGVVEQTLDLVRHHAKFKHCPVRLDLDGGPAGRTSPAAGDLPAHALAVLGDPDQLTQILMVLLLNAADAVASAEAALGPDGAVTDRGARGILVRTRRATLADPSGDPSGDPVADALPAAILEVCDEGIGMEREIAAHVFDPFYTTKAPGEGTGLGLAICYGLVRDLGGTIDVTSTPHVGTTFRVTFPAA